MHTLEISLRQDTFLIHFQGDQECAMPRPTEIKPKLDKFLISKINDHPFSAFWINTKNNSLKYALKIPPRLPSYSKMIPYKPTKDGNYSPQFPNIFGNIRTQAEGKYFLFFDKLSLTFKSDFKDLLDFIEAHIAEFFSLNNLGYRKSKGFGSFSVVGSPSGNRINLPATKFQYEFEHEPNETLFKNQKNLFRSIELLSKSLKSGINTTKLTNGFYFKSMMFHYASRPELNEQWDKKSIREHFYRNHEKYTNIKKERTDLQGTVAYNARNKNKLLFRDLLGLTTEQEWMGYGNPKRDKNKEIIKDKNGQIAYQTDVIRKYSIDASIERFQAPLVFKPICTSKNKHSIFLLTSQIPDTYTGHTFNVKSSSKPKNELTMKIPDTFDLEAFLHFAFHDFWGTTFDFTKNIVPSNIKDPALFSDTKLSDGELLENIYFQLYSGIQE